MHILKFIANILIQHVLAYILSYSQIWLIQELLSTRKNRKITFNV